MRGLKSRNPIKLNFYVLFGSHLELQVIVFFLILVGLKARHHELYINRL